MERNVLKYWIRERGVRLYTRRGLTSLGKCKTMPNGNVVITRADGLGTFVAKVYWATRGQREA